MHDERRGVDVALVANRVRRTAPQRNDVAWAGDHPVHRTVGIHDVEGELAAGHVVDLGRLVPVHDRRTASGWHPDRDGGEISAGLAPRGEHGDLVSAEHPVLGVTGIDR